MAVLFKKKDLTIDFYIWYPLKHSISLTLLSQELKMGEQLKNQSQVCQIPRQPSWLPTPWPISILFDELKPSLATQVNVLIMPEKSYFTEY